MTARDLYAILSGHALRSVNEGVLQCAIAECLTDHAIQFHREFLLDAKDRPDFMVGFPGVAIEVKVDGGPSEVMRQLSRYAKHDRVLEILLVTTRAQHMVVPSSFNGKPIVALWIGGTNL